MTDDKLSEALKDIEVQNKIEDDALFLAEQFKSKVSTSEIIDKLVNRGYDRVEAERFTEQAKEAFLRARRKSGNKDLIYGFTIFGVGLLLTGLSLWAASISGGVYILTFGVVISGIVFIVRGFKKKSRRL